MSERRTQSLKIGLLLLFVLTGCSKKSGTEEPPGVTSAVAPPSPTPTGLQSPAAAVATDPRAVVEKWNDLHRERNAIALGELYADGVEFYGQKLSRDRVVAMKTAAFAKAPDFTQSIASLKMTTPSPDQARAEFIKSWTQGGKPGTTTAVLELKRVGTSFKVTKETDGPSEALKNRTSNESPCERAIIDLVMHTEPAKGMLMTPMPAGVRMGMRFGAGPPDEPNYSVAVHEVHEDHLATLAWYDVDPKTGTMRDTLDANGPALASDPALSAKVREACK